MSDDARPPAPTMRHKAGAGAIAGVVAAVVGLGVGHLVAGFKRGWTSPMLDVGDRVIDRVPQPLKQLAIDWFGTNDKPVLLWSIGAAVMLAAACTGALTTRYGWRAAAIGVSAFGAAGVASAVFARTGRDVAAAIPALAAAAATGAALWWQLRPVAALAAGEPAASRRSRRAALAQATTLLVGAAVATVGGRRLAGRFDVAGDRARQVLPPAVRRAAPAPAAAQSPAAVPLFTPNADFYRIDTALAVPQVPIESWSLRVHGLVERELTLTFDDLIGRFDVIEADITLTCVSNTVGGGLTGTARWLGVLLDDVLALAGVDSSADQVVGRSVDGYTCGFPVAALDGRQAVIAVGMNGEPLPVEHGYPARLIVPGIYGYASATKWLTEIELTTFAAFDQYWVPRGYAALAPIKMSSRIDTPRGLQRIPTGPFVIGGVAWAQPIGIARVEVAIDEGAWQDAELAAEVNGSTWRQWSLPWDATPGRHSITVRATDRNGAIQTADRSEPFPDGASGHHNKVVLVDV